MFYSTPEIDDASRAYYAPGNDVFDGKDGPENRLGRLVAIWSFRLIPKLCHLYRIIRQSLKFDKSHPFLLCHARQLDIAEIDGKRLGIFFRKIPHKIAQQNLGCGEFRKRYPHPRPLLRRHGSTVKISAGSEELRIICMLICRPIASVDIDLKEQVRPVGIYGKLQPLVARGIECVIEVDGKVLALDEGSPY